MPVDINTCNLGDRVVSPDFDGVGQIEATIFSHSYPPTPDQAELEVLLANGQKIRISANKCDLEGVSSQPEVTS